MSVSLCVRFLPQILNLASVTNFQALRWSWPWLVGYRGCVYIANGVAVVLVNQGEDSGKLAVIAEILDHNRAIIDGPSTGVKRQSLAFRRMNLTPFTLKKLPRGAGPTVVKKHFEAAEIAKKWSESSWAKKLEAVQRRKQTTDFERFQIMILKKQRRSVGRLNLAKAKKANKA